MRSTIFSKFRLLYLYSIVFIIGVGVETIRQVEHKPYSDLVMDNVEALSQNEGGLVTCIGLGSIDCPNGTKVLYVILARR